MTLLQAAAALNHNVNDPVNWVIGALSPSTLYLYARTQAAAKNPPYFDTVWRGFTLIVVYKGALVIP